MTERIKETSISKNASLRNAMEAIQRGACGIALIVDETGRLFGVMTDGDIRRALLGGASLDDAVETSMHCKFTAVSPTTGRSEVIDLLRARSLSQIPIVDERGTLVGLHLLREIVGAVCRPNWAVVMAGGRGERLRPLTDTIPKPMVKVAGRPILERIIHHLVGFGIRRIYLSVNYLAEVIEEYFGDGTGHGCSIEYLRETKPLGTCGSLSLLPARPEEPLLILNGDLVTQFDVGSMIASHTAGRHAATVGVHEHVYTVPYGVVEVQGERVAAIREKPSVRWLTNAGIYLLAPSLLDLIPADTLYTFPELFNQCLDNGLVVGAFSIDEDWLDVGQHHELRRARGQNEVPSHET